MQQSRFPLLFVQMKRLALQLFIPPFYLPRQSLAVSQKTHRELGGGLKILSFGFSFSLPPSLPGNLASTHRAADLGKIAPLIGHGFSEEYENRLINTIRRRFSQIKIQVTKLLRIPWSVPSCGRVASAGRGPIFQFVSINIRIALRGNTT